MRIFKKNEKYTQGHTNFTLLYFNYHHSAKKLINLLNVLYVPFRIHGLIGIGINLIKNLYVIDFSDDFSHRIKNSCCQFCNESIPSL